MSDYIGAYKVIPPRYVYKTHTGIVRKIRSNARSIIFAISSGVRINRPYYPNWINVKFHSSLTWKYADLHAINASAELNLTRDDAERVMLALQSAINAYDAEEARSAT